MSKKKNALFPPILQLHPKSLYFLSKHSNLEPKHGLLRVGTTYAGFYLKLNILWQKSTNISGSWPRSTLWSKYSPLPLKTFSHSSLRQTNKSYAPHVADWSHTHTVKPIWCKMNGKPEMTSFISIAGLVAEGPWMHCPSYHTAYLVTIFTTDTEDGHISSG